MAWTFRKHASAAVLSLLSGPPARAGLLAPAEAPPSSAFAEPELGVPAGAAPVATGWETFTIDKTPEESAETRRLAGLASRTGDLAADLAAPPEHDTLSVTSGFTWRDQERQVELAGSGRIAGLETSLGAQLTLAEGDVSLPTVRLSVVEPRRRLRLDAGDLSSPFWSLGRGARVSLEGGRHRPSLSYYAGDARTGPSRQALAIGDEIQLSPELRIGGELSSDGALAANGRLRRRWLGLSGYYRHRADAMPGSGFGILPSLQLPRGLALQGGFARGEEAEGTRTWETASLRAPLLRGLEASIDGSRMRSQSLEQTALGLGLVVPLGRARLFVREYWFTDERSRLDGEKLTVERRQLAAGASYAPGGRLSLDSQMVSSWSRGDLRPWLQTSASYRLSRLTRVQAVNELEPGLGRNFLRLTLEQQLPRSLELLAEIGRRRDREGDLEDRGGLRLSLRKRWSVATPPGGAVVSGRVADGSGGPVPGAIVQLGRYRAATDAEGTFELRNVPPGDYDLDLDPRRLPAGFAPAGAARRLRIGPRERRREDLVAVPLSAVQGVVYLDRDRDLRRGPGEGLAGAVLRLGGRSTASGADGGFGFYNLEPGQHRVLLDADLLPPGLAGTGSLEIVVVIEEGRAADRIEFRIEDVDKPVLFQDLPARGPRR